MVKLNFKLKISDHGQNTRIKQESQKPNLKLAINAKDDNDIPPN
jgi:hypothetical protein